MFIRTVAAAAVLVLLSAPTNAFYCPKQGKSIDKALSAAGLSADQQAEVKKLRDQGMSLHGSGDHKGAVTSLAKATRIILGNIGM